MGIIEKQATSNVIYSYIGAVLGFITVMSLSHLFTPAENGVIRILVSYAALFSQFSNLGFTSVTIRFFPYFRNKENGHNGFLFYAILVSTIGFLLFLIAFFFIKPHLISTNQEQSPLFVTYIFYLIPLTLFTIFFNIFDSYLRACYSSVTGPIAKEFIQRILILLAIFLFFLNWLNFQAFILLYIILTCFSTLILLVSISKKKEWHIKPVKGFITKSLMKEMFKLGIYSILAGGAGAIILNIDTIMVNQLLGEKKTGVYSIAFYFGSIILIPARSLYRITSSIVAENFKHNKIAEIHKLYNKTCNGQLAIGILLFIGISINIDNIMQLLPAEYASGKNVILILSAGYLIEMATGINQVIIVNSNYYKYDTYFVFSLVVVTIITNYIFIPLYGIVGSAIATAITVVFSNILRYWLLYNKYQMQPYDINTIKIITIGVFSFIIGYLLPFVNNLFFDIVIRSILTTVFFILLILKSEATPDINHKIRKNLKRFSINL